MSVQADRSSEYRTGTAPVAADGFPRGHELFNEPSGADRWVSYNHGFYRTRGKRVFDVVGASMLLLAFAPLMLVLAALVSIGGGQPLFAHPRVRRHGRTFGCLKFRSMRIGAPEMLAEILAADPVAAAEWQADRKLSNDPRVTRIGAFLRRSSLDELPQLICVLRGEMSLVGPRPITEDELFRYGPARSAYLSMRPGLTGLWQVMGRNEVSYSNRVAMDVLYARKVTFGRDIRIVLLTGLSMLRLTGR